VERFRDQSGEPEVRKTQEAAASKAAASSIGPDLLTQVFTFTMHAGSQLIQVQSREPPQQSDESNASQRSRLHPSAKSGGKHNSQYKVRSQQPSRERHIHPSTKSGAASKHASPQQHNHGENIVVQMHSMSTKCGVAGSAHHHVSSCCDPSHW
jgi:hypothetical protein